MRRVYNWFLPILALAFLVPGMQAQDIVAQYDFSGKANDISIYANHAANHGAVLTEDRFSVANRAYWFDGVMSYLEADGFVPQLQSPTTTISFWVRVNALPAQGEVYLLSHGGWQERWKISLPSHGKPVFTTNHENGISDMDSGTPLEIGVWTMVTMVHDGLKDIIYFDGVQVAEKDVVGNLNTTFRRFGIGHDPIDGGGFFNGAIDEVTIWDGALDAAAVQAWYDAQAVNPVFTPGEVAHYPMNGNLLDVSPYMNHAVGTDVDFITNKFGFGKSAALFDGDSAKAVAANSAQLNSPETSVAFWIKANTLPGTGEYYVASHGGWQERWKISLPSHGKLVWTTNHTNGISDMDAGDAGALVAGEWAHAVFVHDGLKDLIYINGVLVAEKDVVGTLNDTEFPLGIGYNPIDGGNYFDGALDEFIIYNYALSASEVSTLYTTQNNPTIDPTPLVANFTFSGDYTDASQYRNDGEPHGSVFTQDRFGYANNAVYLNQAYVEVPNSEAYNSDYTTVSFWVNMKEIPGTGEVYLMSYGGWQERWKISLPSHGKPVWTTNNSVGISDMDAGSSALVPGTWTHVVFSHGPAQDKIYFDGVLVNSKDVGGTMNDTKYNLGIGWNQVDGGNFMNGDVDEVRIYNRDLTDQEVLDLYNEQRVEPVITDEVVANYPLNGNAVDVSPYNNHGTVYGAVPFSDRFFRANHSMRFDGVDDYILAANSKQLNTATTSVSFWVNVNNLPANGEAYLLSFGGWQERWKISLPTHGKVVWTTNNTSGISDMDAGDGNALVPGTWMHVVVVHDGTNDCIYINGNQANCKAVAGDLNNTGHNLGIGFNPIDGGSYLDGSLDDVMIFNRGLNAAEVLALYTEQNNPPLVTDVTAPCPPENLKAEVVFTTVTLSWTASTDDNSGVAGYNVFLNNALVATTTETTWTFTGLAPLTAYEMGVSAVDSAGNQSTVTSMTVTTGMEETPDTEAPSTPANLVVSPGANSAVFSWDPSIDNVAVAGYVVSVDGNFVDSLAANETSIFIGGLDPETLYAFEVYAFDFAGNNSEQAFIVASTTEPIVTAEPGLVAHYKFEGNADDSTPYNNHGTIGGNPTFETATHPNSGGGLNIDFDGDRDSVLVPNAVQLISDYATIGFWVRPDDQNLADAESYILDFGNWDERWKISLPQHLKVVWTTNSHNAQFDHFISDMDSGDGNELVLGFWWYVTMVHDGTDDIIYLDGVEVNRKPVDGELNATARPLGMGNNPDNGGQYFIGGLDEVKIYNKALTSAEIAQLYATGTTGLEDLQQIGKYVEIIYPNPTKDDVVIKHSFAANQDLVIRVYDQAGRQVGANRFDANALSDGTLSMKVSDLESGMYNLNFVLGGKNLGSVSFVKQ